MIRRYYSIIVLLVVISLMFVACGNDSDNSSTDGELSGTITISGAFALYPMMTLWGDEFHKIHPKVNMDISAGGAGKGMTDAISGAVDIGMVSRSVKSEEEARGAYGVAVTKDAVFLVVNADNTVADELMRTGVTKEELIGIYITGEIKTWGEVVRKPEITDAIHVYTRSDACGASEMWAKYLGDKKQEDLLGIAVNADPGLLEAVIKDRLGIGYNNLGYAFDLSTDKVVEGALVIPLDVNVDGTADADEIADTKTKAVELIATGKYPSPPARALNLVTKGKPTGLVQSFIQWILTDGQQFVGEAGYVRLTSDQLDESLNRVR